MKNQMKALVFAAAVVLLMASTVAAGPQLRISHENFVVPCYGMLKTYSIYADSLDFDISSFKLTLAVDENSFAVISTGPGDFVKSCDWEYFTTRLIHGDFPNHPEYQTPTTGLLEITGFASATQAGTPTCFGGSGSLELAKIKLLIGYRGKYRNVDCGFEPLAFYFRDCRDNRLMQLNHDSAFIVSTVRDLSYPYGDTTGYVFPGYGGPGEQCNTDSGTVYFPVLKALNSGFELICADTVYACAGDINLNGFPYESADFQLFMSYFINGIIEFQVNPPAQLDQTDIDGDGMKATIADLVFMARIINGDVLWNPYPFVKPSPLPAEAVRIALNRTAQGAALTLTTETPLAGVYLKLTGGHPVDLSAKAAFGHIGDTTTLLLINRDGSAVLPAGRHRLTNLNSSDIQIAEVQAVDENGREIATKIEDQNLPFTVSLSQNFPNPFNPETRIDFDLPTNSTVSLTVFDILGRHIRSLSEGELTAGHHSIVWDGRDDAGSQVASGVYLYRLSAGSTTLARKMLLLK